MPIVFEEFKFKFQIWRRSWKKEKNSRLSASSRTAARLLPPFSLPFSWNNRASKEGLTKADHEKLIHFFVQQKSFLPLPRDYCQSFSPDALQKMLAHRTNQRFSRKGLSTSSVLTANSADYLALMEVSTDHRLSFFSLDRNLWDMNWIEGLMEGNKFFGGRYHPHELLNFSNKTRSIGESLRVWGRDDRRDF